MTSENININAIDECVDIIIDNYYADIVNNILLKTNDKQLYIKKNYVELKTKTLEIIKKNAEISKIKDIITIDEEYNKIIDIFTDYTFLYLFFYIAPVIELDKIIELLNNLNKTHNDIFFKNKYIAQYNKYYKLVNDYHLIFEQIRTNTAEKIFSKANKINNEYIDIISSIEQLGIDIINIILGDKTLLTHNIVKIIIFGEIYQKEDKLFIYKLLENNEFKSAEYKYIEVIDSKYDSIDYTAIESLFSIEEIKLGVAEEIYQMINDYEMIKNIKDYTIDTKINQLFTKNILIPITDEFLRYHKESDLFEKNTTTIIDPKERTNLKNNTKIKYIINKVNKTKDYYSLKTQSTPAIKAEIEKNFYQPLLYRKAIIINDIEEVNIIRKLELQGKSVTDANEYYEELLLLRRYPYLEFNTTKNNSFKFAPTNTVISLRYANFEFKNDPKVSNIAKLDLQYRVINSNNKSNIVGIALPKTNPIYKNTYIGCNKVESTYDMSLIHKNSYKVCMHKLKSIFLNNKSYSKIFYWLFNKQTDKIKLELFDNIEQLPIDDYIKVLLGTIYDEMVNITYESIIKQIVNINDKNIFILNKIINQLESSLVIIPRQSIKYAEIKKIIYFLINTINDINLRKDLKEDYVNTSLIKLPKVILEKIVLHIINIKKEEQIENQLESEDIYEGHICQHTITWNNLLRYRKTNPNKFNQELFNFIKKFIIENKDKDFICKSCYQLVDLRKYISDSGGDSNNITTDTSTSNITISYNLEVELETIYEYTKYSKSIKNLDKMIEKITYGANLIYFVGGSTEIKFRRQNMIKMIIDLIEIQFKTLHSNDLNMRKERLNKSTKNYGCSLTNFFLFKLDNEIFTYSSKEIDKFKLFKLNNILTYILLNIIVEINHAQILNLTFDKLVNYYLFTKFGFNLFDNLYIRISNSNDIAPIKNYKLLCYVIYYISGIYAKLNMWYNENTTFKPNTINPQIQRIIIHTFVDCINSILEINITKNKNYIYSIISNKFLNKLNYTYTNNASADILKRLNESIEKKVSITSDKKLKYNISYINNIIPIPFNDDGKFILNSNFGTNTKIATYPSIHYIYDRLKVKKINDILSDEQLKNIKLSFINDILINNAKLYDNNGYKRKNPLLLEDAKKLNMDILKKISDNILNIRIKADEKLNKKLEAKMLKINMKNLSNQKYVESIKTKSNIEILNEITKLINRLEKLIGKDININNFNYYLNENVYEINHDYRGNKRKSIFINENENIIKFKKDDPVFKQDVYYYEDKVNQVVIYYSAIERYIIAYKENSKDYTIVRNSDCYIKINYSIFNQLKFFGFNYIINKIDTKLQNINTFINNILSIRLQNLKNAISIIQQIIYQVKNNFTGLSVNPIAKYYQNKIKTIQTYDKDGERIFNNWSILTNTIYHENILIDTNINITVLPNTHTFIKTDLLLKYISNDDILFYYILEQFNMLLDINTNSYIQNNIAYMIINMIIQLFNSYNKIEKAAFDINVKKFYHYISTKVEVSDITDDIDYSNLSEEDIERIKEERDVNREELDALDADQDETNEDFGDEDIITHDRVSGEY